MLIDLHCHAKQRSHCSRADEEDMIRHTIRRGLDGIAITDHNTLVPPGRLQELNNTYHPFMIFSGIEITLITAREPLDFLVLGLHDPRLETMPPSRSHSDGKRNIQCAQRNRWTRWTYKALRRLFASIMGLSCWRIHSDLARVPHQDRQIRFFRNILLFFLHKSFVLASSRCGMFQKRMQ